MISAVQNLITNPTLYNMTQNTVTQITTETCLKAVGRPAFILADQKIDPQTKKFSATKEFLYQLTCLGIYLSIIIPVCRKSAFKAAKKLFKDEKVFQAFKSTKEFSNFYKMNENERIAKLAELNKNRADGDKFTKENINTALAKGSIELGSMFGSVTGLAIIAPIVSHPLIHPIMKKFGITENKQTEEKKPQKPALQAPNK